MRVKRAAKRALWATSSAVAVAAVVGSWVRRRFIVITVDGMSMTPALYPGQRVLVRRGASGVSRGRVVIVAKPDRLMGWLDSPPADGPLDSTDWFIKRVVAVAGDEYPAMMKTVGRVPDGHVIVMGDHPHSQDSKQNGPCPMNQILGVQVRKLPSPGVVLKT